MIGLIKESLPKMKLVAGKVLFIKSIKSKSMGKILQDFFKSTYSIVILPKINTQ